MTTLFDATLALARELKGLARESTVTSGTNTTMVDESHEGAEDAYKGSCLWFLSGDLAGVSVAITAYSQQDTQYTFADAGDGANASDRYAVGTPGWPRWLLIQAINRGLREVGEYGQVDESLVTVAEQAAYELPAGVANIERVELARSTTTPYNWGEISQWREYGGYLIFNDAYIPQTADLKIRLMYNAKHAEVVDDDDEIYAGIDLDWLKYEAAVRAYAGKYGDKSSAIPEIQTLWELAMRDAADGKATQLRKLRRWKPQPKYSNW